MKPFLVITLTLAGCGLQSHEGALECFAIEDCGDEQICFLGHCVDPGYSIQSVHAELTPPSSSGFLPQHTRAPLDLQSGYQTLSMHSSVVITGVVSASETPREGTLIATTQGTIEGRPLTRQAAVGATGYSLRVVPDTYDLRFLPAAVGDAATSQPPPIGESEVSLLEDGALDLAYPSDMFEVHGRLLYSSTASTGIDGALVQGTAEHASGSGVSSGVALSDEDGAFTLLFPPGAQVFTLTLRPGTNPFVPETTLVVELIDGETSQLADVVLGLDANPTTLNARVESSEGMLVEVATVFFEALVGDHQGKFVRKVDTQDGTVESDLLPGEYTVTVMPNRAQPYALSSTTITVPSEAVVLTVQSKMRLSGTVTAHDGSPVGAARVVATLRDSPTVREYSTVTVSNGEFAIDVDPGTADAAKEYELVIEPPLQSGLPRHRQLLRLGESDHVENVTLYKPTFGYGKVLTPGGEPLRDVSVSFYSLDLGEHPVLVGTAVTGPSGEFALPLPTP